ncbi:hypothetical protein CFAM422_009442 [Trichoderma lentiforme]|uniref:Uncharacterized protein n=1 Tax=Trichoderma lentiforme TaxID=1567552 RepID=A0A9P5CBT3_9HYPO|nr:hypothetical protein CFAM422_009442 [Trichoderma lentiforme]
MTGSRTRILAGFTTGSSLGHGQRPQHPLEPHNLPPRLVPLHLRILPGLVLQRVENHLLNRQLLLECLAIHLDLEGEGGGLFLCAVLVLLAEDDTETLYRHRAVQRAKLVSAASSGNRADLGRDGSRLYPANGFSRIPA